jgi:hypothetical protein
MNPGAVEAALRLGGKAVWMPTIDAGYHAQVYGDTGGYGSIQQGGPGCAGIWLTDASGRLKPEVEEACKLVAERGAILGTVHISPKEIVALVTRARELGVEKICVTQPFDKVPNLDLPTLEEVVRLGGMPEFGYFTVSPTAQFASPDKDGDAKAAYSMISSGYGPAASPILHQHCKQVDPEPWRGVDHVEVSRRVTIGPRGRRSSAVESDNRHSRPGGSDNRQYASGVHRRATVRVTSPRMIPAPVIPQTLRGIAATG